MTSDSRATGIKKQFVVVGGSLYSLVLVGALLNDGVEPEEILLVESSTHLGGQFRSDLGSNDLLFDKGTRILYETGDLRADSFIKSIVEKCPSKILSGNRKDIGGTVKDGQFNHGSVFPSFRGLTVDQKVRILGEILMCVDKESPPNLRSSVSLSQFLDSQFGTTARELIHEPICRKIFGRESGVLSNRVLEMIPLGRLSGLSHQAMKDLAASEELRSRLAFPNQLELPPVRHDNYSGFYPEKNGIQNFVDTAESLLREAGVEISLGCSVTSISTQQNQPGAITMSLQDSTGDQFTVTSEKQVIWTSGLRALALCAGINPISLPEGPNRKMKSVHFMIRDNTPMGELYYAYCHEPNLNLFRITNYSTYCGFQPNSELVPITAEFFDDGVTEPIFLNEAIRELCLVMGIQSRDPSEVRYVGMSKGVLPVPDLETENIWSLISAQLAEKFAGGVSSSGLSTGRPKFLGREVVNDLLSQIDMKTVLCDS
jgi:protoporphyrinogen oxidase